MWERPFVRSTNPNERFPLVRLVERTKGRSHIFSFAGEWTISLTASLNAKDSHSANVIMWLDHRAVKQADHINAQGHPVLKYVGNRISPEMEPSKVLWLKENQPQLLSRCGHLMDLADFLTFRATGNTTRSSCTLVCKWLFRPIDKNQTNDFWKSLGLLDVCERDVTTGPNVLPPGSFVSCLTAEAAEQLGLTTSVAVGVGMIDAHAGALTCLATSVGDKLVDELPFAQRLSMICGTSTCHMALSKEELFVQGIWGPYPDAVVDGMYLNEAGQSSVGPILDHIVTLYSTGIAELKDFNLNQKHCWLEQQLKEFEMKNGPVALAQLTKDIHIWPDYHGNRSPLADPTLTGAICGLKLPEDVDPKQHLMAIYLAHIQSFAYSTRHIVETLQAKGHHFGAICMVGGLSNNNLYVKAHSDVLSLPVIIPQCAEPVAYGAAMLGAVASRHFVDFNATLKGMAVGGTMVKPTIEVINYHNWKYQMFLRLGDFQIEANKSFPTE